MKKIYFDNRHVTYNKPVLPTAQISNRATGLSNPGPDPRNRANFFYHTVNDKRKYTVVSTCNISIRDRVTDLKFYTGQMCPIPYRNT